MRYALLDRQRDAVLLIARILLMVLFVLFGCLKVAGFSGTVEYMVHDGLPLPQVAAALAVVMELVVGAAIVIGYYTRPLALLLAVYTLVAAFIGHRYWDMSGAAQYANMINFYKNVSIMGGLLLLVISGPGKYSVDRQ